MDVKKHDRRIKTARTLNSLTIKPITTLLETYLRLNYFPASGIIKSIEMNNINDVKMIKDRKRQGNFDLKIVFLNKLHRHFQYSGSISHYTSSGEPSASRNLDISGPVPHVKERYPLIMIDSVSRFMIATKKYTNKKKKMKLAIKLTMISVKLKNNLIHRLKK